MFVLVKEQTKNGLNKCFPNKVTQDNGRNPFTHSQNGALGTVF